MPGTVVDVTLTDMHGMAGMMRAGVLNHELVVLPLAKGQYLGQGATNPDFQAKVDAAGSAVS